MRLRTLLLCLLLTLLSLSLVGVMFFSLAYLAMKPVQLMLAIMEMATRTDPSY